MEYSIFKHWSDVSCDCITDHERRHEKLRFEFIEKRTLAVPSHLKRTIYDTNAMQKKSLRDLAKKQIKNELMAL